MTGSVYLIGGGEIRSGETELIDIDIKSIAPAGATFVFFGFAAQDNTGYSETITSVFGDKFSVLVPTVEKGREYAISAIKLASVIYLGGGNTDLLMSVFSEWELTEYLIAALARGTHIVGMSAGALALSAWYLHEDDNLFELRKGWGVVQACVQVHANQNSVSKAKALWQTSADANSYPFVAIGECAALQLSQVDKKKIGNGKIWQSEDMAVSFGKLT